MKKRNSCRINRIFITGFFLFSAGICHLRKAGHKNEQIYLRDPLTDGYNRNGFLKECACLVDRNGGSSYAVVCMNVCNFRNINEIWGEDSGNKMLQFIYRMLSENITGKEAVCRSDTDHFIMLLHESEEDGISARIRQIICRMNESIPAKFGGYALHFTIGSCFLDAAKNLNAAINNSYYAAKLVRQEDVCIFYNEETAKKIAEENDLNDLFEESIRRRDFKVYLQPKVSSMQGISCQAEALVRWQHPEKGIIYPNQFIPMFEKNGKIGILDLYVFEEVCRLIAGWLDTGKDVTKISVNISRYHMRNAGVEIWKKYGEIKEKYGIPDGVIEIELTETLLIDRTQISFMKQILDGFRSCGLNVALDDFGFAYSSLSLLKEFEVDTLKLDRSFFVNETEKSRIIVENIIRLAHSLNMCVVAEGIESEEQVTILRESRCDLIQGYVYARPLTTENFEKWRAGYEK